MYFSIGAHPAFNINSNVEDYYLEFNCRNNIENIALNGPYNDKYTKIATLDKLNLSNNIFKNDAIIYTNIDGIKLKSKKEYALEIICTHTKETTPNANILGRKISLNVYKISLPFTSLFISIIFLTFKSTNPKMQPNTVDNIIIIKELTIAKYIISLE